MGDACVYFMFRSLSYSQNELYAQELKEKDILLENVRICYSPFSRTRHTAEVVASILKLPFEGPQCKVIFVIFGEIHFMENSLPLTLNCRNEQIYGTQFLNFWNKHYIIDLMHIQRYGICNEFAPLLCLT